MGARQKPPGAEALLLFPGAGTGSEHPSLVAIEEGLAPFPVQRADFPYRKAGRKAPDRATKLIAAVQEEAAELSERLGIAPDKIALGGRSMGGRICSLAVAEGLPAAALVLVAYPLHPPGKPEKLRVDHFPQIDVPCLFISGTRDAFGKPEELESHTPAIEGDVTHVWIEGKGHDLKGSDEAVAATIHDFLVTTSRSGS